MLAQSPVKSSVHASGDLWLYLESCISCFEWYLEALAPTYDMSYQTVNARAANLLKKLHMIFSSSIPT